MRVRLSPAGFVSLHTRPFDLPVELLRWPLGPSQLPLTRSIDLSEFIFLSIGMQPQWEQVPSPPNAAPVPAFATDGFSVRITAPVRPGPGRERLIEGLKKSGPLREGNARKSRIRHARGLHQNLSH
jgi:hypothetical protein